MARRFRRASCAAASRRLVLACTLALAPAMVRAQAGEEVILDPELSDVPTAAPAAAAPPPAEPNGEAHFSLRSRVGGDVVRDAPREDLWELSQYLIFEAKVRRSERLRFAVGIRARHFFAARAEDTEDANAERYSLDVVPTAGYGDVTITDGLHLRLGYQSVFLGQFDLINITDILSIYDLRSGPTAPEDAYEIAQPAVRIDWDMSSSASLTVMYVPFFQTHRWSVLDGDYAFYPNAPPYNPQSGVPDDQRGQEMLRRNLTRSVQANLGDGAFAAFTPDVNLKQPQAAAHLTLRGSAGEFGLTAGYAYDQTPAFRPPDLKIAYLPYQIVGIDGTTDVGSVQVGFEVDYMVGRTLLTTLPGPIPPSGKSDVAHLGVRVNYAPNEDFALVVEGTATRAMADAALATGVEDARWLWLYDESWWFMLASYVTVTLGDATFSIAATALNGPSYVLAPKAEVQLVEGLSAELGAYFVGQMRAPMAMGLVPGGLYDHVDQVFLGLHWAP